MDSVKKHRGRRRKGKITMTHVERSLHENRTLDQWTKRPKRN